VRPELVQDVVQRHRAQARKIGLVRTVMIAT
jgi:hypothetical protein